MATILSEATPMISLKMRDDSSSSNSNEGALVREIKEEEETRISKYSSTSVVGTEETAVAEKRSLPQDQVDVDGQQQQSPTRRLSTNTPYSRKPSLLMRPLDKMLLPDYGSSNTGTTTWTAEDSEDNGSIRRAMSQFLPITTKTEKLYFRKHIAERKISIDDINGENIGFIDYTDIHKGRRYLKDKHGRICSIILHLSDSIDGFNLFKICSDQKPATSKQRKSNETGYYTWAEVKNSGDFGGKFIMNLYCDESTSCTQDKHVTKPFGSLFNIRSSRGFIITNEKNSKCIKMVTLNNGDRGIMVAPNKDLCLMLSYAAIVDEMVENRLR